MEEGRNYGKFTDLSRQTLINPEDEESEEKNGKAKRGEKIKGNKLEEVRNDENINISGSYKGEEDLTSPVVLSRRRTTVNESRREQ